MQQKVVPRPVSKYECLHNLEDLENMDGIFLTSTPLYIKNYEKMRPLLVGEVIVLNKEINFYDYYLIRF